MDLAIILFLGHVKNCDDNEEAEEVWDYHVILITRRRFSRFNTTHVCYGRRDGPRVMHKLALCVGCAAKINNNLRVNEFATLHSNKHKVDIKDKIKS